MNPRRAAIAAALVTVVAVVAVVFAVTRSSTSVLPGSSGLGQLIPAARARPAPALAGISHFDNTPPLTLSSLKGRVVVVDFWTYTCINCRRTFPFLHALEKAYGPAGLTILGVHSPEFGFEKEHANVARAVRELGVTWPVAEDPDMSTWDAFANQYWPADYLVDRSGKVRFAHFGEGDDTKVEQAVRDLLAEGGTDPGPRIGQVATSDSPGDPTSDLTPETYLGADRGPTYLAGGKAVKSGAHVVRHDGRQDRDIVALEGAFVGGDEYLELGAGALVRQRFHARDVYATVSPTAGSVLVEVTLDGKAVPLQRRGRSLMVRQGRTYAAVSHQDLLHLITGPDVVDGALALKAPAGGVRLFTFTYGA